MSIRRSIQFLPVLTLVCMIGLRTEEGLANEQELGSNGNVSVQSNGITTPVDPENPEETTDPGEGPSTQGHLRIDYVSSLDFGNAEIKEGKRVYQAHAQQFFTDTGPRGSYIQLTDQRAVSTGWSLQVKQNYQFRNAVIQDENEQELAGAVLSLDKAWANSSGFSEEPTVTRETIAINEMNTAYELANASTGSGKGIWTITFGASESNSNNQEPTLTLLKEENGTPIIDEIYQKPIYSNSAVTITIPENTKVHPVLYETAMTWILAAAP